MSHTLPYNCPPGTTNIGHTVFVSSGRVILAQAKGYTHIPSLDNSYPYLSSPTPAPLLQPADLPHISTPSPTEHTHTDAHGQIIFYMYLNLL